MEEDRPYMEWTSDLSVGVDSFDDQHKKLISLLNEMHTAMKQGRGKSVLDQVLSELADYTDYHFKNEEKAFTRWGYPYSDQHKKEHSNLMKKVRDLQLKNQEEQFLLSIDVLEFLKGWVAGHIKGSDMKYTDFFRKNGVN